MSWDITLAHPAAPGVRVALRDTSTGACPCAPLGRCRSRHLKCVCCARCARGKVRKRLSRHAQPQCPPLAGVLLRSRPRQQPAGGVPAPPTRCFGPWCLLLLEPGAFHARSGRSRPGCRQRGGSAHAQRQPPSRQDLRGLSQGLPPVPGRPVPARAPVRVGALRVLVGAIADSSRALCVVSCAVLPTSVGLAVAGATVTSVTSVFVPRAARLVPVGSCDCHCQPLASTIWACAAVSAGGRWILCGLRGHQDLGDRDAECECEPGRDRAAR